MLFQEIRRTIGRIQFPKGGRLSTPEQRYHYKIPCHYAHNPTWYAVPLQDRSHVCPHRKGYLKQVTTD